MEKLSLVAFCPFLHDLFGEISKLRLVLQKNLAILPLAVGATDSCVATIKGMKDKLVRYGKLEEFLSHTNLISVSQPENAVQQDKAQKAKQTRWQKKEDSSDFTCISSQNIQLKGCDLAGFSEELNHLQQERKFSSRSNQPTQPKEQKLNLFA